MAVDYDVIVSGLGPAGSSAAYSLSSYGLKVLALEKKKMPRNKLCAGGITSKVLSMLDFDFSDTIEKEIRGGAVHYKQERSLEMTFDKPAGYVVDRAKFDHKLALRAGEAGAVIHEEEALKGITELSDGVEITTGSDKYRARFLVGADGANGFSSRYFNRKKRSLGFAVETFVPDEFEIIQDMKDKVAFFYGNLPFGYGWIFPKRNGASVGLGISYKHTKEIRKHFADFLELINIPAEFSRHCQGYPIPAYSWFVRKTYCKRNIILTGDAANLVDPVTGEGIYFAMKSGEVAADAIKDTLDNGRRYPRVYKKMLRKEVIKNLSSAYKLTYPIYWFPTMSFFALRSNPNIKKVYIDVLLGKATYKDLLREAKIAIFYMAKSLFKRSPAD